MLLPHELRIGNYVLVNKKIKRITLINNDPGFADIPLIGFHDREDNFISCSSPDAAPVPLTDDILTRCGFVFHAHFHFWELIIANPSGKSVVDIDPDYNVIDFMRKPIVKKLSSLHQLQNLFFALKGVELEFGEIVAEPRSPLPAEAAIAEPPGIQTYYSLT